MADAERPEAAADSRGDSGSSSASAHKRFQYRSLETKSTFRLLRLDGRSEGSLSGSLHHFVLGSSACPQYRALSYTWGKDAADSDLHMPHGSTFKIRENLHAALLSLRDAWAYCWLWIDAICIDQESNLERNHQIQLMAEIYSSANVVVAWLQSSTEQANVAEAFEHIKLVANQEALTGPFPESISDSLYHLIRLRYWKRIWVIQEVLRARTLFLYHGASKCSMTDFEQYCRKVITAPSYKYGYIKTYGWITSQEIASSVAGRLAIQRLVMRTKEKESQLLWKLVDHYADSECERSCDHVYALHSLVGRHRTYLPIDYGASPIQRLVDVVEFMCRVERLPPLRVAGIVQLLMCQFDLRPGQVFEKYASVAAPNMTIAMNVLGSAQIEPESEEALHARNSASLLLPIPRYSFDRGLLGCPKLSRESPNVVAQKSEGDRAQYVGPPDMAFFRLQNSEYRGLATCRLDKPIEIWHIPDTKLAFVAQLGTWFTPTVIIGRAYCFRSENPGPWTWSYKPWLRSGVRRQQQTMTLDLVTLLKLIDWANAEPDQRQLEDDMAMRLFRAL